MDFTPHHKIPLFQDDALFKMNTDTSALMKCMKVKKGDTVLDIGTNHGVVLLEASVYEPSWMTGIDINPLGIDLALKNMQLNHIHNVSLLCQDVTETKFDYKFDVVLSNPHISILKNTQVLKLRQFRMPSFQTNLILTHY